MRLNYKNWPFLAVAVTAANNIPNCDRYKQDVFHLQDENTELRLANLNVTSSLGKTTNQLHSLENKVNTLNNKVEFLEGKMENSIDQIVAEKMALESAKLENKILNRLLKTHDKIDVLENKMDQETDNLEKELENLETQLENVDQNVDQKLDSWNESLNNEISQLEVDVNH